jgi:hypothetical protein
MCGGKESIGSFFGIRGVRRRAGTVSAHALQIKAMKEQRLPKMPAIMRIAAGPNQP